MVVDAGVDRLALLDGVTLALVAKGAFVLN